jgi:myo-inositol-1(or 4)-monophosphatase
MVSQRFLPVLELVRQAGVRSLEQFGRLAAGAVEFKGDTDLVTVVDRDVEQFLRDGIAHLLPGYAFLGEEGGATAAAAGCAGTVVVDPIDGTANFVHGLPQYAVSLAVKEAGRTVFGVVHAPALNVTYCAEAGAGAWKNGAPIHVSATPCLIEALGATGFACVRAKLHPDNLPIFNRVIYLLRGIRRLGSAALDLCLVAEGRLDLYWEIYIQPWDIAAGALIVREAGGQVSDLHGGDAFEGGRQVLATNGRLHAAFLRDGVGTDAPPLSDSVGATLLEKGAPQTPS